MDKYHLRGFSLPSSVTACSDEEAIRGVDNYHISARIFGYLSKAHTHARDRPAVMTRNNLERRSRFTLFHRILRFEVLDRVPQTYIVLRCSVHLSATGLVSIPQKEPTLQRGDRQ